MDTTPLPGGLRVYLESCNGVSCTTQEAPGLRVTTVSQRSGTPQRRSRTTQLRTPTQNPRFGVPQQGGASRRNFSWRTTLLLSSTPTAARTAPLLPMTLLLCLASGALVYATTRSWRHAIIAVPLAWGIALIPVFALLCLDQLLLLF